jgi:hypothetical protein
LELILIVLPQNFHAPDACYVSATASFTRGTSLCRKIMERGRVVFVGRSPMEMSRDIARFARSRLVIECAQCGERIYIPE